jgi:hypothetical protein
MGDGNTSLAPQSIPTKQQDWPEFKVRLDWNAGVYDAPRKTPEGPEDGTYFTNNTFLRLFWQPQATIGKYWGIVPLNLSGWTRTADSDPKYSKTTFRIFAGPAFYARLIDDETWRLQLNDSPNIFYGHDLNEPAAKRPRKTS